VRKKDDQERYVGYLFCLMVRIINMAEYIRNAEVDPTKIKELTNGIPKKEDIPKVGSWSIQDWTNREKHIHK